MGILYIIFIMDNNYSLNQMKGDRSLIFELIINYLIDINEDEIAYELMAKNNICYSLQFI